MNSVMPSPLHQNLRKLVGQHFLYLGEEWALIEVLADEDRVVLQRAGPGATPQMQADQYGHARRHVPETLTLRISGEEDPGTYSEELMLLFQGRL